MVVRQRAVADVFELQAVKIAQILGQFTKRHPAGRSEVPQFREFGRTRHQPPPAVLRCAPAGPR